ncbi:3-oxoadipate enol-lactonase [Marivibrio halodurans]|uniref:3-oxoadipate enol-lactonase n=1 Tax=Marivibrio halodurans TaxID=2039722 RepID=A0A8J7V313_9PROT|nr:3-oxoadipate enol-lactonase [Marivibrio halodurans]MBP5857457.1 3-oxoadipate enol-lactonase [Marivibrio halodurans]
MQFCNANGTTLHYSTRDGDTNRCPIVFLNSLGTDLRIWDDVLDYLPDDIPVLRLDKRGHGLSDIGPCSIPILADDVSSVMEVVGFGPSLICGVSVGGLIAQQFALSNPDLIRGLVLSNTGAKIGSDEVWNSRIEAARAKGIGPIADAVLERWFSRSFLQNSRLQVAGYRNMLCRTTVEGYVDVCAAIRDTDLRSAVGAINAPSICISGSEDLATPPDLLKELSELIPGSDYRCIEGVGHIPSIEAPRTVARIVMDAYGKI